MLQLNHSEEHMREVVAAIVSAAPGMRGKVTFEERPLPFPEEVDVAPLARVIGPLPIPRWPRAWRGRLRCSAIAPSRAPCERGRGKIAATPGPKSVLSAALRVSSTCAD